MERGGARLLLVILLSLTLPLAGCLGGGGEEEATRGTEDTPSGPDPALDDPFTEGGVQTRELASGLNSSVTQPIQVVIKEEAEWAQLWEQLNTSMGSDAATPRPEVDFEREWVIAALDGERPNDCYDVRITNVLEAAQHSEVEVTTIQPEQDEECQGEPVTPYHIVAVPHLREPVMFKNEFEYTADTRPLNETGNL